MDDKLKSNKGHVDFGEKGTGKKLVAIHHNEDGTMDLETDDGIFYKNCFITDYKTPPSDGAITQSIPFDIKIGEVHRQPITFDINMDKVEIYKENLLKAMGYESQDGFSAKLQSKTIDSVD